MDMAGVGIFAQTPKGQPSASLVATCPVAHPMLAPHAAPHSAAIRACMSGYENIVAAHLRHLEDHIK